MTTLIKQFKLFLKRGVKRALRPLARRVQSPLRKLLAFPEMNELNRLLQEISSTIDRSDNLTHAMFQSVRQANVIEDSRRLFAVNLAEHRLLTLHPEAPFMLVDSRIEAETPAILVDRYQTALGKGLAQLVLPGDTLIDLGAGQGFHTLSFCQRVGRDGYALAVERDRSAAGVLSDNLSALKWRDRCAVMKIMDSEDDFGDLARDWLTGHLEKLSQRRKLILIRNGYHDTNWCQLIRKWIDDDANTMLLMNAVDYRMMAPLISSVGFSIWTFEADGAPMRTTSTEIARHADQDLYLLAARHLV